jgi:O-antigen biosynthesis protein WbqP
MYGLVIHRYVLRPKMVRPQPRRQVPRIMAIDRPWLLQAASSALALVLLSPCLVMIGIMVKCTSRGPALHVSLRAGRHGQFFNMPKFRTMKVGTPQVATDRLAHPAGQLTPVGGLLRKLSLDELPQLWSVIKGDMSLVGPRPALFNQHELISARKARGIDALRPGITGWAQVNGRDDIPEWRKVELDEEYLRNRSLWLDLKILWLTGWRVVRGDGVSH